MQGNRNHNQAPIELLRVYFGSISHAPDPAKIESIADWYILNHVSSGLIGFDHKKNQFHPLLAEEWKISPSGAYEFRLRDHIFFHDGTPILARDVVATIKRLLIKKSSTHFPLWEHLVGCENVSSMSADCAGVRALDDRTIRFELKKKSESFFVQLSSPETGIWHASDIDEMGKLHPTKYSGPYSLAKAENGLLLTLSPRNPISVEFPSAARKIFVLNEGTEKAEDDLRNAKLDLLLRIHNPLAPNPFSADKVVAFNFAPSVIIYFHGTDRNGTNLVGQDFLKSLWHTKKEDLLWEGSSFLPFSQNYSLSRDEFLAELPQKSGKKIRLALPWNFFSNAFIDVLRSAATSNGISLETVVLSREDWWKSFDDPEASKKYDFILAPYDASERYPEVQLRFLTGTDQNPPIDLKTAEAEPMNDRRVEILKNYQRWLLKKQLIVPLYFTTADIFYSREIDLGEQSPLDAELELWRVVGRK